MAEPTDGGPALPVPFPTPSPPKLDGGVSRQAELLAALLASISEGVVICDERGVLQSFNRAAREFHGEDLTKTEAEFMMELQSEKNWAKRFRLLELDGRPIREEDVPLKKTFTDGKPIVNREIKTTGLGKFFPFYVTGNEVRCSEDMANQFHLFRVFDFGRTPRVYILTGSLKANCQLEPTQYRATI